MEDIIKVCALGGLDENGRDCYVIEINNDIFVLDAGLALPDKTIPGVDFLLTNAQYIISNKDRVKAKSKKSCDFESSPMIEHKTGSAPSALMFCATLAAPPRRAKRLPTATIGTGASGEMRSTLPLR